MGFDLLQNFYYYCPMNFLKKSAPYIIGFILLAGVFSGGVFAGFSQRPAIEKAVNLYNKEVGKSPEVDFEIFWKSWNIVKEKYATDNGFDEQKMVWGAIQGMVGSLGDPYTAFFPPAEKQLFESEVRGDFEGVGMEIGVRKNILTIIAPLKGTPAYKAGLKAGDKILKIDEKEAAGLMVDEAVRLIRGKKGTVVQLTILRDDDGDEPKEFKVTRDVIQIPLIDTEIKTDKIFVIKLYSFSEKSPEAFRSALREMIDSGSGKLILDLRSNPGGYLEASVDIASWFLPMGKVVVKERFNDGREIPYRSKGYNIFNKLPMVILINQGSASASEILAGSLQDYKIAALVGEKSFGKGSVQEMVSVTDDTALKVTIARWLTPNGVSISKEGLTPDYEVKITKEDIENSRDPQMEKAIEILKSET